MHHFFSCPFPSTFRAPTSAEAAAAVAGAAAAAIEPTAAAAAAAWRHLRPHSASP